MIKKYYDDAETGNDDEAFVSFIDHQKAISLLNCNILDCENKISELEEKITDQNSYVEQLEAKNREYRTMLLDLGYKVD